MSERRVMYIQYTDPAAYPPLEHSAHIFAEAGWDVLFVAIDSFGARDMKIRAHERIKVMRIGAASGGMGGLLKYTSFAFNTAAVAKGFRPSWIYASDALSAPAARLAKKVTGARVLYHEHDVPAPAANMRHRGMMRARDRLIASADVLVVPADGRRRSLGRRASQAHVVWNCPLLCEVAAHNPPQAETVTMVYAGSISPDRLPLTFIDALAMLPSNVRLRIVGYQTVGSPRYLADVLAAAERNGVTDRVTIRSAIDRAPLLDVELSGCNIGIATINPSAGDESLRTMAGASNKAFDYMARGLPFLVNNDASWREMFVDPGYALACEPSDPASIVAAVTVLLEPGRRDEIGDRARRRIQDEWNYERQFAPVLAAMST